MQTAFKSVTPHHCPFNAQIMLTHWQTIHIYSLFYIYTIAIILTHVFFKIRAFVNIVLLLYFFKKKEKHVLYTGEMVLFLTTLACPSALWMLFFMMGLFLHVYTFFLLVVCTILLFPALSCELVTNPVLESWALDLERYDWIVHRGGIYFPAKSSQSLQRRKKRRGPKRPGWPWRLLTALCPIAACRQQQISKLPGRLRAAEQPRRVLTLRFPSGEERAACLPQRRHDALLAGCFLHGRHWWAVKRPRHR